jgi:ankyrin repeat protein
MPSVPNELEQVGPLDRLDYLESFMKGMENRDIKDRLDRILLHTVCVKNWHAEAQRLLRHGANLGTQAIFGSPPLHCAVASGFMGMCELLLENIKTNNSGVDRLDKAGLSAQDYALRSGNTMIIVMLQRGISNETLLSNMAGI